MAPASIVKIAVSAFVVAAACGTALVFGVKREARLETGTIAATSASQPASSVPTEASSAPAAVESKQAKEITELKEAEETKAIKETRPATVAAPELAGQPELAAADQSAPSFDLARIEENGDAVIAGRAAPGASVELLRGGERLDRTVADASGDFVMVSRLPPGNYELSLSAKQPDGKVAFSKKGVAVEVNNANGSSGAAQSRAEYIPESGPQARLSLQSPLPASKPQQRAALKPAHVNAGNSPPEENVSSPAISPRNVMRVTRGDSLWRISRITYGDGARYAVVYRANRDRIQDPNLIHPGQILLLPLTHH